MTILFLALWLQMSAPAGLVKFPCPEGALIGIVLGNNQTVDGSSFTGYPCPFSTKGRKVVNTTIEGVHYEWCQTRKGNTECKAAQRAADETDGKPLSKLNCTMDAFTHKISPPECADDEPVDVPAVQETLPKDDWPIGFADTKAECDKRGDDWLGVGNYCAQKTAKWTCKDTSRVLLTSEDGKKHCIKF